LNHHHLFFVLFFIHWDVQPGLAMLWRLICIAAVTAVVKPTSVRESGQNLKAESPKKNEGRKCQEL
jgi:hypothetical protein